MDKQTKKQVLNVSMLLNQLATEWRELPSDVQELVANDVQELSADSLKALAKRLFDTTCGYDATCPKCGKSIYSKRSTKRFCSDTCPAQWNKIEREKKMREDYEAAKAASTW